MSGSKVNDKELYSRLKKKDKEAFIAAYDAYLDHIYRFVFFKVSSSTEAEDITSQVFLKAWNHIQKSKLRDYKTLKSLLYKIARNTVIDHYRKKSRQLETSLENQGLAQSEIDEAQDIHKQMEIATDFENISERMKLIKDEYREVILLRYVNELSFTEIAEILSKTKGNTRVLLFRAMKALKEVSRDIDEA
jgi:RNA polymerase sigma-70 factor (ECF subfamily)